jgi:hypothetical protein
MSGFAEERSTAAEPSVRSMIAGRGCVVPSEGARRGRRDNGLEAAEYAALCDVDPRVGEHLLDVFAGENIAAYLQPTVDLHPVNRAASLPSRPIDRLFVDRARVATARDYLDRIRADGGDSEPRPEPTTAAPVSGTSGRAGSPDVDVETAWAQIVAGFNADVAAGAWPGADGDSSGAGSGSGAGTEPPDRTPTGRRPPPPHSLRRSPTDEPPPSLLDGLDTFGANLPDDPTDDEGYVPPPAPPLPRPSLGAVLAACGIVGGMLVFLNPEWLPIDTNAALIIGFLGVLGGFVTLIWRLRPGDESDDIDPGDGAQV